MKLETWTSIAALGLSVMFVTILLSFYNFLIGPDGKGPDRVVDPGALLYQEIFISAVPCLVRAGFVFFNARTHGDKLAGLVLIAAGVVMIVGMAVGTPMVPHIQRQYVVGGIDSVPYIFMAAGAGVVGAGGYLVAMSRKKFAHTDLDDLR
ncbi:MAG TPA: hypothetical protein VHL10_02460 [Nitrososphaera sp.]|nr:hypothetical protein [Nitrososphaera sp.]